MKEFLEIRPDPEGDEQAYQWHHLSRHLIAARRHDDLYKLLTHSRKWLDAKYDQFRSDQSFMNDVGVAMQEPYSDVQIITLGALKHLVNYRTELRNDLDVEIMVWIDRAGEALAFVRLRPDMAERVEGLLKIHQAIFEKEKQIAEKILGEIERSITQVKDHIRSDWFRCSLSIEYAKGRQFFKALEVFGQIAHPLIRMSAAHKLAVHFDKVKDPRARELFDLAAQGAASLPAEDFSGQKFPALFEYVQSLAATWQINEAGYWASVIGQDYVEFDDHKFWAVRAFGEIIKKLVGNAYLGALDYLEPALDLTDQIRDPVLSIQMLVYLSICTFEKFESDQIPDYRKKGYVEWITETGRDLLYSASSRWHALPQQKDKDQCALDIVCNYAKAGMLADAEPFVSGLPESMRNPVYLNIALILLDQNEIEQAQVWASGIENARFKAEFQKKLALSLARQGDERAARIFDEAMTLTADAEPGITSLLALATFLLGRDVGGAPDRMLHHLIGRIINKAPELDGQLDFLVSGFGKALIKAGKMDVFMHVFNRIADEGLKARLICSMHLWKIPQFSDTISQAYSFIRNLEEGPVKAQWLALLARALDKSGFDGGPIFEEAIQTITAYLGDLEKRDEILMPDQAAVLMRGSSVKAHIIKCLADAGRFEQAGALAASFPHYSKWRKKAAIHLIRRLCRVGISDAARQAVSTIGENRQEVVTEFFYRIIKDGDFDRALKQLESLRGVIKTPAEVRIKAYLAFVIQKSNPQLAAGLLKDCGQLIRQEPNPESKFASLAYLADIQIKMDLNPAKAMEKAGKLLQTLSARTHYSLNHIDEFREGHFRYIKALLRLQRFGEALELARTAPQDSVISGLGNTNRNANRCFHAIARALIGQRQYDWARSISFEIIDDEPLRRNIKNRILNHQLKHNNIRSAVASIGSADLDSYIAYVASWPEYAKRSPETLFMPAIIEVIRIASWVVSDWKGIYDPINHTEAHADPNFDK